MRLEVKLTRHQAVKTDNYVSLERQLNIKIRGASHKLYGLGSVTLTKRAVFFATLHYSIL